MSTSWKLQVDWRRSGGWQDNVYPIDFYDGTSEPNIGDALPRKPSPSSPT
jgi:hypothetical protein